jgi:hypothetical protein
LRTFSDFCASAPLIKKRSRRLWSLSAMPHTGASCAPPQGPRATASMGKLA